MTQIRSQKVAERQRNRSHPGEEFWMGVTGEMCVDRLSDEGEGVSFCLAAGFDDGENCFHEAAAGVALGAEGEFSPDHRMT